MNRQPGNTQRGFSLIELTVVVGIVAILAAIAVPLYLAYTTRAQGSEALSLASGMKPAVAEYYNLHGSFRGIGNNKTKDNTLGAAYFLDVKGRYVRAVKVNPNHNANDREADIVVQFCKSGDAGCELNKRLSGAQFVLSAWVPPGAAGGHAGAIQWVCWVNTGGNNEPAKKAYKFFPSQCRHFSFANAIGK